MLSESEKIKPQPECEIHDTVSFCGTVDCCPNDDMLVEPFDVKKFAKEELAKAKKEKVLEHRRIVVNSERPLPNFQKWEEKEIPSKSGKKLKPRKDWFI